MPVHSAPRLDDFPDSPYAAELRQAGTNRRFAPELESEYVRADLVHNRTLIRVASLVAVGLASSRALEQLVTGSPGDLLLTDLVLVVASSIVLAVLAWKPIFERLYLPWAQVIVPVRNAIAAAHLANAAAHGQLEMLMVLPLLLIGPFFFMGLRFATALLSGLLTTGVFVGCAALLALPLPVAWHADLLLVMGLVGCTLAARQLEIASRTSFLEGHLLNELARRDALTGMENRRVFDEHLARVWQQAATNGLAMAILLIDVDHFKAYNDRYGHLAGDEALRRVARTVQAFVQRPFDILCRYGGEEFAAVLYDVNVEQAQEMAERMRRAVSALSIEHRGSKTSPAVTVSIGIALIQPTFDRNSRGALQLADQALYEAKLRGRNRVEMMDDAAYQMLVTGVFPNAVASTTNVTDTGAIAPSRRRSYRDGRHRKDAIR